MASHAFIKKPLYSKRRASTWTRSSSRLPSLNHDHPLRHGDQEDDPYGLKNAYKEAGLKFLAKYDLSCILNRSIHIIGSSYTYHFDFFYCFNNYNIFIKWIGRLASQLFCPTSPSGFPLIRKGCLDHGLFCDHNLDSAEFSSHAHLLKFKKMLEFSRKDFQILLRVKKLEEQKMSDKLTN
ncbi:hypothetical protein CEXT_680931 [Caerostris extrusa]|uniref:Uncharacterized protein n=1 Tax=Caerostris extrusa TaxID=172846 RepID=A0AAV4X5Z6_CAEEX|nr:hypothetical protein CEXT_680931 [Caerostris extrusa]